MLRGKPSLTHNKHLGSFQKNGDDARIRRFLAYSLTVLMFFLLIVYLVTRADGVLTTTAIFAIAHTVVYPYYFRRRRD